MQEGSVNHKRVWRVMRQAGLTCRRKRRTVHTTDSKHSYQIYPNLVKGLHVEAPNRCWVADLTYVRLPEGFVYLACILDVYSRRIMYRLEPLSSHRCAAASQRRWRWHWPNAAVTAGLIHHSDRGRQYCSNVYVERLLDVGANISMSTPGQPTENAFAESFFKTLKYEEVYVRTVQPKLVAETRGWLARE